MENFKRIELEYGSVMISENYTPEIKDALNQMCKLLIEAISVERLATLEPDFNNGKYEKGKIKAFIKSEQIIKSAKASL